jgi:hypothetical protein
MMDGKFPTEMAALYGSAKLIPLKKKNNGVRPIAVGEVWRRITGKYCPTKLERLLRSILPHINLV